MRADAVPSPLQPVPAVASQALNRPRETEDCALLNGGTEAFPRMLEAISFARERIHLEVYTFESEGVGARFMDALVAAAKRGVSVKVVVDGWGSIGHSTRLTQTLRAAGVKVRVYNPLTSLCLGRAWRNHRKILLVDDTVAFLGGINIGDAYAAKGDVPGWADLAVELRGDICRQLGEKLTAGAAELKSGAVSLLLSGFSGGHRLRKRYLAAIDGAKHTVTLAHAYFLPDNSFVKALTRAARRGVKVSLLLAGRSDVVFARAATMRLYNTFLHAGVNIHEWTDSTLHAKAAVVDGRTLLVGSFNLDPLSLVNLETLVEVQEPRVAAQAVSWLDRHITLSRSVLQEHCTRSRFQRWMLDVVGLAVARFAERFASFMGRRRKR
ncbi:phospholipase D-like domain-containing protein [Myxococcus stipitatus]|uniref:phospholipase D-like domain-containing protein n=1 Tax=Myxococcus stipitatus TaxID=83455 RepID=UPI0030CF8BAC